MASESIQLMSKEEQEVKSKTYNSINDASTMTEKTVETQVS